MVAPAAANLATMADGDMKPGAHYALSATTSVDDITVIMGENADSLERVALVDGNKLLLP